MIKIKTKILGHHAKITVKKSPNEKTNYMLQYQLDTEEVAAIQYGSKKRLLICFMDGVHSQTRAWISADESFLELLKENNLDFPEKIQGESKLSSLLEEDKLSSFLASYFKTMVCQ